MDDEAQERLERLNREMGEKRVGLAREVQDLHEREVMLTRARQEHQRLTNTLDDLEEEITTRRRDVFARKVDLEGARRRRSRVKTPVSGFPDRRIVPRVPYQLHVNFGGLDSFYAGFAVNVSDGGLLVATCDPPPLGRRFAVEFNLDSESPPIRCPVEAVWLERVTPEDDAGYAVVEVGLRFLGITPDDRQALHRFVREYASRLGPIRER